MQNFPDRCDRGCEDQQLHLGTNLSALSAFYRNPNNRTPKKSITPREVQKHKTLNRHQ
jgi:hypothetical protein